MATETFTVTRCDICGESGEDVKRWTLRMDGQIWEVDVDGKKDKQHSLPLTELVLFGRATETSSAKRGDNRFLERRVRNVPNGK